MQQARASSSTHIHTQGLVARSFQGRSHLQSSSITYSHAHVWRAVICRCLGTSQIQYPMQFCSVTTFTFWPKRCQLPHTAASSCLCASLPEGWAVLLKTMSRGRRLTSWNKNFQASRRSCCRWLRPSCRLLFQWHQAIRQDWRPRPSQPAP